MGAELARLVRTPEYSLRAPRSATNLRATARTFRDPYRSVWMHTLMVSMGCRHRLTRHPAHAPHTAFRSNRPRRPAFAFAFVAPVRPPAAPGSRSRPRPGPGG